MSECVTQYVSMSTVSKISIDIDDTLRYRKTRMQPIHQFHNWVSLPRMLPQWEQHLGSGKIGTERSRAYEVGLWWLLWFWLLDAYGQFEGACRVPQPSAAGVPFLISMRFRPQATRRAVAIENLTRGEKAFARLHGWLDDQHTMTKYPRRIYATNHINNHHICKAELLLDVQQICCPTWPEPTCENCLQNWARTCTIECIVSGRNSLSFEILICYHLFICKRSHVTTCALSSSFSDWK